MTAYDISALDGFRRREKPSRVTFLTLFSHVCARDFLASILKQVLVIMTLVEAIFLAERFPMVFRDVLQNHADLLDTSLIFALTSPQIFDLALALAIVIAVYWTTLRMRESRELLVLSSAGLGPRQLMALPLVIAVIAQLVSLAVSGVIDPASRYTQRVVLYDAQYRALTNGNSSGQFYFFKDRVAFAPRQSGADATAEGVHQRKNLFVYVPVDPGSFRVITADRARIDGVDSTGHMLLRMRGYASRLFSFAPQPGSPQGSGTQTEAVDASNANERVSLNELLPFAPRGAKGEELSIFEQMRAKADPNLPIPRLQIRMLGERIARSLLCLLAPLIAIGAVRLTSRHTHYLALPLACMVLMSLNVTAEWLIRALAPASAREVLALLAVLTAGAMIVLLAVIIRGQNALCRPQLARA